VQNEEKEKKRRKKNLSNEYCPDLSSSEEKLIGNSPKRSKTEIKSLGTNHENKGNNFTEMKGISIDNVANQIIIENVVHYLLRMGEHIIY